MGVFSGRRETLTEQLAREAGLQLAHEVGLGSEGERRRPARGALARLGVFVLALRPIRAWWARRRQRKLAKYTAERGYLSEQATALKRTDLGLRTPGAPGCDRLPHIPGGG